MKKFVVFCNKTYPSSVMRARPLDHLGFRLTQFGAQTHSHFDVAWVLKKPLGKKRHEVLDEIRRQSDRVILDPLDFWPSGRSKHINPSEEWLKLWKRFAFDDIVAPTPAAAETMAVLEGKAKIHVIPHHADTSIRPSWYDPDGHVAYAGLSQFLNGQRSKVVEKACNRIGRKFVRNVQQFSSQKALRGAALVLCIRTPPFDACPVCRYLKAQVKLENAAAATLKLVYNGFPSETSIRPGHPIAKPEDTDTVEACVEMLRRGLSSERARQPFTVTDYVQKVRHVISA